MPAYRLLSCNNRHVGLVFTHIPKTAGSAVHEYLSSYSYIQNRLWGYSSSHDSYLQHLTSIENEKHVSDSIYYRFAYRRVRMLTHFSVIRDPVERVVSAYNQRYSKSSDPSLKEMLESKSIEDFIGNKLNALINGKESYGGNIRHLLPQSFFIKSPGVRLVNIKDLETVFDQLSQLFICKRTAPKLIYMSSRKTRSDTLGLSSDISGLIKDIFFSDYELIVRCETSITQCFEA